MKKIMMWALILIAAAVLILVVVSSSDKADKMQEGYNKKTNLTIDGVPFYKAKGDAAADIPPPPPVLKR